MSSILDTIVKVDPFGSLLQNPLVSPYNDLEIPNVLSGSYLVTRALGVGLFTLCFVGEAFRLQVDAVRQVVGGHSPSRSFNDFLIRSILLLVSWAFLYKWVFLKMVSICGYSALILDPDTDWTTFLKSINDHSTMSIRIFDLSVPDIIGAFSIAVLDIVQALFVTIRFVILGLLYLAGPILWALSVSELGEPALKSWFKNTWQVCFWLVVFSLIKRILITLGVSALDPSNPLSGTVIACVYAIVTIICIWAVPTLTAALFSGANIGAVSSAAMAIASYSSMRFIAARGESLVKGREHIKSLASMTVGTPLGKALQGGSWAMGKLRSAQPAGGSAQAPGAVSRPPIGSTIPAEPGASAADAGRSR